MKISKSKLLKKAAYVLLCVLLCSVLAFGTYAKYALNLSTNGSFTANVYSKYSILYKNIVNGVDQHFYGNNSGAVGNQTFNIKNANNDGEMRTYGESAIYLPYTWDVNATLSNAQKLTGGELLGWSEFEPGEQKQSTIIGEQYHIREGGGADGQGTKDRTLYTVWQKEVDLQSSLSTSNSEPNTNNKIDGTGFSNMTLGVPKDFTSYASRYRYFTKDSQKIDTTGCNFLEFDLYIPDTEVLAQIKECFPTMNVYIASSGYSVYGFDGVANAYAGRWNLGPYSSNLKTGHNYIILPFSDITHLAIAEKNRPDLDIDFSKIVYFGIEFDIMWNTYNSNGKDVGGYDKKEKPGPSIPNCVVSGIKFTTVANDAPKALGESDYTTGIDAVMAKQAVHYFEYGEKANHSDKIPTGGTYYRGVTNNTPGNYSGATQTISSGQNIGPGAINPEYGDVYVYGDYEYRYNRTATSDHYWNSSNNNLGGWGVIILNRSKVSYGQVLWEIADKPIISLNFTFGDADNLGRAPEVPPSVTSMYRAFNHCDEMLTAPKIPEGVTSTHGCFSDCYALREPSNIPSTVRGTDGMSYMFYDCVSMLYAPKSFPTDTSVTSMDRMFWDCQSIKSYPTIPNHITNLHSTFANNLSLVTAPNIPTSAVNMHSTFSRCEKITTVGAIPQGVVDLGSTFNRCMSLRGEIIVNAVKLDSYANAFDYAGATFNYDRWTGVIDESTIVKTHPITVVVTSTEINHVKTYWQNSTKHCNITVQ